MSLDNIAISDRKDSGQAIASVSVWPGGLVAHRHDGTIQTDTDARRGIIVGFSLKSRARLRKTLMRLPFAQIAAPGKRSKEARAFFVTLTYPKEYPNDAATIKRHLAKYRKRLARMEQFEYGVWRVERQKRGAPHYHLVLVFSRPLDTDLMRSWFLSNWWECVQSDDQKHRWRGCDTRVLFSDKTRKLLYYLLKYLSKPDGCATGGLGRLWGTFGQYPKEAEIVCAFYRWRDWVAFVRRVRRWAKHSRYLSTRSVYRGFDIVGQGTLLYQLLRELNVTIESVRI